MTDKCSSLMKWIIRIAVRVHETSPEPGDVATMALTSPFDIVLVRRVDGEPTLSSSKDSDG